MARTESSLLARDRAVFSNAGADNAYVLFRAVEWTTDERSGSDRRSFVPSEHFLLWLRDDGEREHRCEAVDHPPMEPKPLPILYVKTGCPWCHEVVEFLDAHGVSYREQNVSEDHAALSEMQAKSGQTRAPTMDWNGKILADFGVDELVPFLRAQNVKLEES